MLYFIHLTRIINEKLMETKRIFNLIILDESGSMEVIKRQAINGFNETVQTIRLAQKKHTEQEHFVSLVTFNSKAIRTVYDKIPAEEVKQLDDDAFRPNGMTPLFDAMGLSLTALKRVVESDDMVLVTIITDGEENSSVEFIGETIKKLVEGHKANGWVFAFIGANQDANRVAATFSVTNVMSFDYSERGTQQMFVRERAARTRFFDRIAERGSQNVADTNYFDENEEGE